MILQLFDESTDEKTIFEIWKALNVRLANDINMFQSEYNKSYELGAALFDSNSMTEYMLISRTPFIRAYAAIADNQVKNGAIDSILSILYALFGTDATITVASTPLHIIIDIISIASHLPSWIVKSGDSLTDKASNYFVFKRLLKDVPASDLASMLYTLINAGTYIDFNLQFQG